MYRGKIFFCCNVEKIDISKDFSMLDGHYPLSAKKTIRHYSARDGYIYPSEGIGAELNALELSVDTVISDEDGLQAVTNHYVGGFESYENFSPYMLNSEEKGDAVRHSVISMSALMVSEFLYPDYFKDQA